MSVALLSRVVTMEAGHLSVRIVRCPDGDSNP
jgi:hypothetical protein